jgi:hypothetical protein
VLAVSIVASTTATQFSVSAEAIIANLPYGGNIDDAATGNIIFSIANGSFLSVSDVLSITFKATIDCSFDWLVLPGGGLYNVSYIASWKTSPKLFTVGGLIHQTHGWMMTLILIPHYTIR